MYERIRLEKMKLTPREAEKLLLINDFKSQRPLKPKKINELSKIMKEGLFLIGEIAVAYLKYQDGKRVLMNGQHQCHACIVSKCTVDVIFAEYVCSDPEDTSLLFRQFDNSGVRSLKDKVRVELFSLGLKWSSTVGSLVTAAISYEKTISSNEKVDYIKHNTDFGEFVHRILDASNNGGNLAKDYAHLRRTPVVYAMLQTFGKHRQESETFWLQVRDGEGLTRKMPAYKLRNFLMTHSYGFGRGAKGINIATMHEMVCRSITAWNAYRRNTTTDLKYYSDKAIPRAI